MAKDFRTSQIETSKIIASGAIAAGKPLGIAIYSGSIASNREGSVTDSAMLSKVGTDVFLFVSGTINNGNPNLFNRTAVSLFGGDVVVSGTLYAERQVIEVDQTVPGDFFVTGNMFVEPDSNSTKAVAFRKADGTDILIVDSSNSRVGIGVSDPDSTLEVFSTSTQLKLSNNADDYSTLAVGTNGALTITTVDAAATSAHFVVVADGGVDIDANAGALSLDGSTGINIGTETDVAIDINSSTLDIDASDAITIDGTSTLSLDAADSTNLTMTANAAGTKTMTISATNAHVSNVSNIDVDADGALTLNGATGATFGDDTEAIAFDGAGNVDFDAVALDLDVTDSSSITITSSEAAEDLTIEQIGANDSSIIITAAGNGADAISIDATAGSMIIGASLANEKTLTLGNTSSTYAQLIPHGTPADEKILVKNTSGTADDAIKIESTAGGVTILAGNDSLVLDADGTDADAINIDSAGGIDIDAVSSITIDGATLSLDTTDSTNLTMAANVASTKTMTISATNAHVSNVSNIDIDADGALTLNGAGGATFGDDTEAIVYDGSGNVNFDAVALDIDATGAVTIDSTATISIDAGGQINLDSSGGQISIGVTNHNHNVNIGTDGTRTIQIGAGDGSSTTTVNSRGGTFTLDGTGQTVDLNSAALDIDSSGAITIDGSSTFSIDAIGTSNVTTNGALTISGSIGLTLASGEELTVTGSSGLTLVSGKTGAAALVISSSHAAGGIKIESGTGNLEVNSDGTVDINSTGAITIDGASTLSLDAADSTNLTMAVNVASTKTMTISATNANGSNVSNIDVDADGSLTLNGAAGATFGDDTQAIIYDGSGNVDFDAVALDIDATGAVTIDSTATISIDAGGKINLESGGVDIAGTLVTINEDGNDVDFRVESNDKVSMLLVDGGTNQILLNNNPTSRFAADEFLNGNAIGGLGSDTGIYLSGSRGTINTPGATGVTTIVGDLVVSGNIFHNNLGNANDIFLEANQIATNKIISNDPTAPFAQGRDTNTYIEFGGDQIEFYAGGVKMLTFDEGTTDHITFNDGGLDVNFRVETNNLAAAIHADGGTDQVVIGGNTATITNYLMGTDTNILLSGTIGSKGTATKGTVVASGDMVVSGTFHNPGIVHAAAGLGAAVTNVSINTDVAIVFDRTAGGNDADGAYSTSTGKFTAPHDGFYQVSTAVSLHSIDSDCGGVKIFLSGSAASMIPRVALLDSFSDLSFVADTAAIGSGAEAYTLKGSICMKMLKDTFFNVFIRQVAGSAQMDIVGNSDPANGDFDEGSWLTITQLG